MFNNLFSNGSRCCLTHRVLLTAGSGKTVLAAGIVDYVFSLRARKTSISYFFCDFNDRRSREAPTILSSLARQILNVFDETPEMGEKLKMMFVTNHREPKIEELSALLTCVAQLPATAYIFIDGLDECEDPDQRQILSFLTKLIRDGQCKVKVIISSRWEVDISKSLGGFRQISLDSSRASPDIAMFIRNIIDQKLEDGSIVIKQPSMAEEIKDALIRKSDGMYAPSCTNYLLLIYLGAKTR